MLISALSLSPGAFILPSSIVDDGLKTVSGSFLKVILYVFKNISSPIDAQDISDKTGLDVGEVNDALYFWKEKGLLSDGELSEQIIATPEPAKKPEETKPAAIIEAVTTPARPKKSITEPSRLTHKEIAERLNESEEIRVLLRECANKLGSFDDSYSSSLILLHDYYGLPTEVILVLLELADISGKPRNMNYIYKVGQNWSNREILTLEDADAELKHIQSQNAYWKDFCEITGFNKLKPTQSQSDMLTKWIERYHFSMSMLSCAYEEMSKRTDGTSFSYMDKILTKWYNEKIDTPDKARDANQRFFEETAQKIAASKKKKAGPSGTASTENYQTPASYDIEAATQKAKTSVPTLKKKEKR